MNAVSERPTESVVPAPRAGWWPLAPAVAYLLAWVAGLSVFSSSTEVRATGAEVIANFRGHESAATTQYLLTEGLTAVLLVLALWPVARRLDRRIRIVLIGSLLAATAVSFAELVLGIRVVEGGLSAPSAATTYDLINRLDGVKMLLLAVVVVAVAAGTRRVLPTWFTALGAVTGLALVVSGLGYLVLDDALASVAFASLPLLIAVVLCTAALARRTQASRSARTSG